jgi:retron-type reverse transcriptase
LSYKDIEKRRARTKERVRRYRNKGKGVTSVTPSESSVTPFTGVVTPNVTPFSKEEQLKQKSKKAVFNELRKKYGTQVG